MTDYRDILNAEFPTIDEELSTYIVDVLAEEADFEKVEDVFDAVSDILIDIDINKSETKIRDICKKFYKIMKPNDEEKIQHKLLNSPIKIGQLSENANDFNSMDSIWVTNRDLLQKVDSKKLERAEAKLQQKLERRVEIDKSKFLPTPVQALSTATASQVINKKDLKMESKGNNRGMDIKIENFDLAFGEKVLLKNADLVLVCGRRYGLVGRNGLGKTTLLRMISDRQLKIPSHIRVLHVEQEVVGDETKALDSVLECDVERTRLLAREKELNELASKGTCNLKISQELSEVYSQLMHIEADKAEAKASIILRGLGFSPDMQARPTKSFSGGWRMRLALARALFSTPDLLLLDEPTNMLDIKAIIWLENYLQNWPTTLLVVSHDHNFLDTVPTDIINLHSKKLEIYKGNYEQFVKTKTEKLKSRRREYEAQMAHRAHVQEFIDRFRYNANRASSVQSKIKMLEKLPELEPIEKESDVKLNFPEVDQLSPPVITLSNVCFGYSEETTIFANVDLCATSDSRICIVGENGAGKSTLLKLIVGHLEPSKGIVHMHRGIRLGYFAQHHIDNLNMNLNCIETLEKDLSGRPVEEYRRLLGHFGISGDLALQVVASLSGGQKSRLTFAKMCMSLPNFIVLDEPTNHLDIETIAALAKAIKNYKGGIILVSHDERLIEVVCEELWVCENGGVKAVGGGIKEYKQHVMQEIEAAQNGK